MKISILTPDLFHNCLDRAYLLAKILQRRYEIEIVGPVFGDVILYGQYHQIRVKKIVKKLLPQKSLEMTLQTIGDIYHTRQTSRFSDKNVENHSYFIAICKKYNG